ncbi:hypothetical protein HBB16_04785 [Pseudonocardia sp. MCCB 268]|nr:hypothetical protein [Pseudonocardia cytotoxica]
MHDPARRADLRPVRQRRHGTLGCRVGDGDAEQLRTGWHGGDEHGRVRCEHGVLRSWGLPILADGGAHHKATCEVMAGRQQVARPVGLR